MEAHQRSKRGWQQAGTCAAGVAPLRIDSSSLAVHISPRLLAVPCVPAVAVLLSAVSPRFFCSRMYRFLTCAVAEMRRRVGACLTTKLCAGPHCVVCPAR